MDFVKHKLAPVHRASRIKMAPRVGRVEGLVASIMACDGAVLSVFTSKGSGV